MIKLYFSIERERERERESAVSAMTDGGKSWHESEIILWHLLATTVHAWPAECMHVLLQVDSNDAFFVQKSVMLQFC